MKSLQFFIDMLSRNRRLHISVLDVNGILNTEKRRLAFENIIHSKEFCRVAKFIDNYLCCHTEVSKNEQSEFFGVHVGRQNGE